MKHVILFIIVLLLPCCFKSYKGELIFVEPGDQDSFNFPYFLFIPENVPQNEEVFMLIEPNNSGFVDDDLQKHIEKAERTATNDFYLGSYVAQDLQIPILVSVFPRARSDWKVYTHALDRDVMLQKGNSLERIDLQLIEMVHDARRKLKERNIQTKEQFLLTGFSASGSFANRFTLMHPEKVRAVAAGGVNGLLMLPFDSIKDEKLKFPVGTADLPELIKKEFLSLISPALKLIDSLGRLIYENKKFESFLNHLNLLRRIFIFNPNITEWLLNSDESIQFLVHRDLLSQ